MSRPDRITIPVPLESAARDSERRFASTGSDVRPSIALFLVPWLIVTYEELRGMPLDARAGYVVSLIDGACSVQMLLDISGLPEDATIDILRELAGLGAIELRDPK